MTYADDFTIRTMEDLTEIIDTLGFVPFFANAFKGIKIAVGILIVDAAVKMLKKMKKKPLQISMVCFAVVSMFLINILSLNISSIVLLLLAAVIGIAVFAIKNNLKGERVKK